jgi:hypothetical protein
MIGERRARMRSPWGGSWTGAGLQGCRSEPMAGYFRLTRLPTFNRSALSRMKPAASF